MAIAERMCAHLGRTLGADANLLALDARTQRDFTRAALELARAWHGYSGSRTKEAAYALAFLRARETVAELVEPARSDGAHGHRTAYAALGDAQRAPDVSTPSSSGQGIA